MRSTALGKALLLGFLLTGSAAFVHAADTVIEVALIDAEILLGVSGEVALASNEKGNLVTMHAKSDANGRVEFRYLTAGVWHLTTKIEGYATEHASVQVVEDETHRVSLYLKKGKLLSGRVVDSEGKPIAQAQVSVRYALAPGDSPIPVTYQWESGEVITDLQGAFEIRDVHPEKEFVVEASHEHFLASISAATKMGPEASLSINLSLQKGLAVTGTVQADDGTPIAGARVGLLGPLPREAQRFLAIELLKENRAFTTSDENGVFLFEQVRPGGKVLLVSYSSYDKGVKQYFDLPKSGQDAPIRVTLSP